MATFLVHIAAVSSHLPVPLQNLTITLGHGTDCVFQGAESATPNGPGYSIA
jgi:hypothetical protein